MPFLAPIGVALGFSGTAAAVAGTVATAAVVAGVGTSIAGAVGSASASKKMQGAMNEPTPTLASAEATAQQALTERRRTILSSGGATDYTSGLYGFGPSIGQSTVQKKTLLGS